MTGRDAEPPVQEVSPKNTSRPGRAPRDLLSCQTRRSRCLGPVRSGLLAAHRRAVGTRKGNRCLGCYRQALFGLAWYRDRVASRGWAPGSACRRPPLTGISARSPRCSPRGPRTCGRRWSGHWPPAPRYVILDGTLVSGDRCREKTIGSRHKQEVDAWYSGKSKAFGGNIQGVFYPDGRPMGSRMCCPAG